MNALKLFPHEWPAADQRLWASITTDGGLFDETGSLAHLRPATLKTCAVVYGRWLFWIKTVDPDALLLAPINRITADRVNSWMASLETLAPYSRVMFMDEMIRIFCAAAPDQDSRPLRRIRKTHHALAQADHGSRKMGRIPCALDLVRAGVEHGTVGVEAAHSTFERARRLRDAAMIVFLAMHPIRRKNFVELEIGRSFRISGSSLRIVLSRDETKTHDPYEAEVLEPAANLVARYLREARPFLIGRGPLPHDRLWVADTGLPYSHGYIGTRIPLLAERLLGVRVAMHFFRDAVATTFARSSSDLARGTGAILGHSSLRTAERHYNHARAIDAGREYASVVRKTMER